MTIRSVAGGYFLVTKVQKILSFGGVFGMVKYNLVVFDIFAGMYTRGF